MLHLRKLTEKVLRSEFEGQVLQGELSQWLAASVRENLNVQYQLQ